MSATKEHDSETSNKKTTASDRFSSDLDELKSQFSELRADVAKLLSHAAEAGKSGAAAVKVRASRAADDVQNRVAEAGDYGFGALDRVTMKMRKHPLASNAVSLAIGYVFARLFSRRR